MQKVPRINLSSTVDVCNDCVFSAYVGTLVTMLVLHDWPGVKLTGETKFKCPRFSYSEKVEEGDGFVEEIKLLPAGDLQVGGNRI